MTHKMFMLITYITCFAIYLGTQQCINVYFRGNISSFMTENNSSRFFWTLGMYDEFECAVYRPAQQFVVCVRSLFSCSFAKFIAN